MPPGHPPPPPLIHTSSPGVNAVADLVNQLADPWRTAPPSEQGTAGRIARVLNTVTGLMGAPAAIVDQAIGVGVGSLGAALGLPQFPALPAATLGTAMHIGTPHVHGHPPSFVAPVPPIPLPSIGMPVLSGCISVHINGMPALRAGDIGPGLTCGSLFPPLEIITGSSSVYIGGARAARMGDMTRHCNPMQTGTFDKVMAALGGLAGAVNAVGALNEMGAADARATAAQSAGEAANAAAEASGKALAAGMAIAQVAADAAAFAMRLLCGKDPGGPPGFGSVIAVPGTVLIGGFPMPNIGDFIMGKVFDKIARLARRLRPRGAHPEANGTHCNGAHPVDIITGHNFDDYLDFVSPSGFRFERFYRSSRNREAGPLGWGMRHSLQHELRVRLHQCTYRAPDGTEVSFPPFARGANRVSRFGYVLRRAGSDRYLVSGRNRPTLEFAARPFVTVARLVRVKSTRPRWSLEPEYTDGRLTGWTEFSDEALRHYAVEYDTHARIEGVYEVRRGASDGRALRAAYAYDRAGCMSAARDALGHEERYEYDEARRLARWTDKRKYAFAWRYDAQGRCVWTSGEDGLWYSEFEYLPERSRTKVTTEPGAVWTYEYDAADGVLLRIEDPYGGELLRVRDDEGRVVREVDWVGRSWGLLYDPDGAHYARVDPWGALQSPDGPSSEPASFGPLPATPQEQLYGGLIAPHAEAAEGLDLGWRRSLPGSLLDVAAQVFRWNEGAATAAKGACAPDVMGRPPRATGEAGLEETVHYDATGNDVLRVDAEGRRWAREAARWNLVGAEIDPLGGRTAYEYTATQRPARITDAGNTTSEYRYDAKDRVVEVWRHGARKEQYRYDQHDRLIEKRDGSGRVLLNIEPDAMGLPAKIVCASGAETSYEHGFDGRPTRAVTASCEVKTERDGCGRRTIDLRDGRGIRHDYFCNDVRVTSLLDRFRVRHMRHSPNHVEVVSPTGHKTALRYDRTGAVFRETFGGSSELMHYSAIGRALGRVHWHPNGRVWSARYLRNRAEELVRVEDSERGVAYLEWDAAGRLAAHTQGGRRSLYEFDAAGNILHKPGVARVELLSGNRLAWADTQEFTYNDRNHVAIRRVFAGSWFYRYDNLDQLIEAHWQPSDERPSDVWRAEYDGLGRRIAKEWKGRRWEYWWDGDRLAAERTPDGKLRWYLYAGPNAFSPIGIVIYESENSDPRDGRVLSIFYDAASMPLWIENDRGAIRWMAETSEPFGKLDPSPQSALIYDGRWPGHWWDPELGLHYNRFRYYDPQLGRYLQSDPIGTAGGVNIYAYTDGNPIDFVDLLGLAKRHKVSGRNGVGEGEHGHRERGKRSKFQEDSDHYELPPGPRVITADTLPMGMNNERQFQRFVTTLHDGLAGAGFPDTEARLQGSGATGVRFTSGEAFDHGRKATMTFSCMGRQFPSDAGPKGSI